MSQPLDSARHAGDLALAAAQTRSPASGDWRLESGRATATVMRVKHSLASIRASPTEGGRRTEEELSCVRASAERGSIFQAWRFSQASLPAAGARAES